MTDSVLEAFTAIVRRIPLRRPVTVVFRECKYGGYYAERDEEIGVCYEEAREMYARQRTGFQLDGKPVLFYTLFHELGHLLVKHYSVPITGDGEDVADQVAFWFMRELLPRDIPDVSRSLFIETRFAGDTVNPSDKHRPTAQRTVNFACLAKGLGYPVDVNAERMIDPDRLQRCDEEAQGVLRGLERTFKWVLPDKQARSDRVAMDICVKDSAFTAPPSIGSEEQQEGKARGRDVSGLDVSLAFALPDTSLDAVADLPDIVPSAPDSNGSSYLTECVERGNEESADSALGASCRRAVYLMSSRLGVTVWPMGAASSCGTPRSIPTLRAVVVDSMYWYRDSTMWRSEGNALRDSVRARLNDFKYLDGTRTCVQIEARAAADSEARMSQQAWRRLLMTSTLSVEIRSGGETWMLPEVPPANVSVRVR